MQACVVLEAVWRLSAPLVIARGVAVFFVGSVPSTLSFRFIFDFWAAAFAATFRGVLLLGALNKLLLGFGRFLPFSDQSPAGGYSLKRFGVGPRRADQRLISDVPLNFRPASGETAL